MNTYPINLTTIRLFLFVGLTILFFTLIHSALSAEASQSLRGEGSKLTQGFHVGNQRYLLNAVDPTKIESVKFTISGSATAGFASVRLEENGEWYSCELQGNGEQVQAICDTTLGKLLNVSDVTDFRVVATER